MQMGDFIRICVLERMGNVDRYFDEHKLLHRDFTQIPKFVKPQRNYYVKMIPSGMTWSRSDWIFRTIASLTMRMLPGGI